jgi:hypothetical protein
MENNAAPGSAYASETGENVLGGKGEQGEMMRVEEQVAEHGQDLFEETSFEETSLEQDGEDEDEDEEAEQDGCGAAQLQPRRIFAEVSRLKAATGHTGVAARNLGVRAPDAATRGSRISAGKGGGPSEREDRARSIRKLSPAELARIPLAPEPSFDEWMSGSHAAVETLVQSTLGTCQPAIAVDVAASPGPASEAQEVSSDGLRTTEARLHAAKALTVAVIIPGR